MKKHKTEPALDDALDDKAAPAPDEALDHEMLDAEALDGDVNEMLATLTHDVEAEKAEDHRSELVDPQAAWDRGVPRRVMRLVNRIRKPELRVQAVKAITDELFGSNREERLLALLAEGSEYAHGAAPADAGTWKSAMTRANRAATLSLVRRVVDQTKRVAQQHRLYGHECALSLPAWQANPTVQDGVLRVRDVLPGKLSFGHRTYLEPTPIEVPVLVFGIWETRTGKVGPLCWDPTEGSGTNREVVRLLGGRVTGSDLTPTSPHTVFADLRELGRHPWHKPSRTLCPGDRKPRNLITAPDIIFLHPPSRGRPSCAEVYGTGPRQDDLSALDQEAYVALLAKAIVEGLSRLATGGIVSVLFPEYRRRGPTIIEEAGTAEALLEALGSRCVVLERHRVVVDDAEDVTPLVQASLGRSRGPLVHFVLEASTSPEKAPSR